MSTSEKSEVTSQQGKAKEQIYRSEELFRGAREIIIEHVNTQYRLMITKAGKLILNK